MDQFKDILIKTSEVAKLLDISVETVKNWGARGKIKVTRNGAGQRRYRIEDIQNFIDSRQGPMDQFKDILIKTNEVAKLLDISVQTVRNWGARGKIKVTRNGAGQRRYRIEDIQNFIAGQRRLHDKC